jgi:hypothetical protein
MITGKLSPIKLVLHSTVTVEDPTVQAFIENIREIEVFALQYLYTKFLC